jgi:serine/threonine protein kinase
MVHVDSDYLAPELIISDRISSVTDIPALVTKETDIFALGVIFWRLLQYDPQAGFNVKESKWLDRIYGFLNFPTNLVKLDIGPFPRS